MHGTVYVTLLNKGDCATGKGRDGEVIVAPWGIGPPSVSNIRAPT